MYLSKTIGYSVFISPRVTWEGDTKIESIGVLKLTPICATYRCATCGREHDRVWWYRPTKARPFGNFMAVRIGNEMHVPDPSLPCQLEHVPRTAIELPDDLASALWHDSSGSHDFTGAQGSKVRDYVRSVQFKRTA